MARRKVTQHDKEIKGRTNLATTYHTELVDSSKKLLSADCVAPTTISPRPPGFVCPQTGPALVTDACRSAHLPAPAPTRPASPPWRMVGAGEGCTARGGARQWRPRRILHLTFRGPDQLAIRAHSGRGKEDPHPIPLLRLLVEEQFVPGFVAFVAVVSY